jgi:hypothetical protein
VDKKTRKARNKARAIIRKNLKKHGYRLRGSKWYMPTEAERKRKKKNADD